MTAITDEQIIAAAERVGSTFDLYSAKGAIELGRRILALTAPAPAVPATAEMRFARADAFSDGYRQGKAEAAPAVPSTGERAYEIRFMNLEMDVHRVINWEKPLNDFEVVKELQEYIAAIAAPSHSAPSLVECPYCHDCHPECLHCNGTGRAPLPDVKAAEPKPDYCDLYMQLADAMDYTSGKDGLEFSPEEWAAALLKDALAFRAAAPIKPEPRQSEADYVMAQVHRKHEQPRQAPSDAPTDDQIKCGVRAFQSGHNGFDDLSDWRAFYETVRAAIAAQAQKDPKS